LSINIVPHLDNVATLPCDETDR